MAATMQGIQKGPGTLPVSPKKADSTTAHTRVMATVALRENRATSPRGKQQHRQALGKGGVQPGDVRQRSHEPSPPM